MFIREMAKRVHLSEDTLRYYEKIGLLVHVPRDAGGHRVYGEVEIEEVQKIVYLKASGLSLNDIRNYLELMQGGKNSSIYYYWRRKKHCFGRWLSCSSL